MAPCTSSTLSKVELRPSLSSWYELDISGRGPELRVHSTVVGGKPVEVQVRVKMMSSGDAEGVARAMGVESCGEAAEKWKWPNTILATQN